MVPAVTRNGVIPPILIPRSRPYRQFLSDSLISPTSRPFSVNFSIIAGQIEGNRRNAGNQRETDGSRTSGPRKRWNGSSVRRRTSRNWQNQARTTETDRPETNAIPERWNCGGSAEIGGQLTQSAGEAGWSKRSEILDCPTTAVPTDPPSPADPAAPAQPADSHAAPRDARCTRHPPP